MKLIQPLCALAALALLPQIEAQTAGTARPASETHLVTHSSKVLGLSVHNDSDKNVGEIGDLLIDPKTGEIRYAVLEVGGFLGMNEDKRIVPWAHINIMRSEDNKDSCRARTSMTEAQVKAAPTCKGEEVVDASLDQRIDAAFGKDPAWAYAGEGKPSFARLSKLDGVKLKDPTGQEVGSIDELYLAPQNSCVAYVILDANEAAGDKDVAVPFSRIDYAYDSENELMASTSIEVARFKSAPEYDSKDQKRMCSTPWVNEIATYFDADPFWKESRFASARKAPKGVKSL